MSDAFSTQRVIDQSFWFSFFNSVLDAAQHEATTTTDSTTATTIYQGGKEKARCKETDQRQWRSVNQSRCFEREIMAESVYLFVPNLIGKKRLFLQEDDDVCFCLKGFVLFVFDPNQCSSERNLGQDPTTLI